MQARQQKITSAFEKQRTGAGLSSAKADAVNDEENELEELIEDNRNLREKLREMEAHLFQLRCSRQPQPRPFRPCRSAAIGEELSALGGEVALQHKRARLRERYNFYRRHFGIQVRSVTEERCAVLYDVASPGAAHASHVVHFAKIPGGDDWRLLRYQLPLAFSLDILSPLEPMSTDYLRRLQAALAAHHSRRAQIQRFKATKPEHLHIFHSINCCEVELAFTLLGRSGEALDVALRLSYHPLHARPRDVAIFQKVYTEDSAQTVAQLSEQLEALKGRELGTALLEALNPAGPQPFYLPTDREVDQLPAPRLQVQMQPDCAELAPEKKARRRSKQANKNVVSETQQKQFDELSDCSTESFNTLSEQLLRKKSRVVVKNDFKRPKGKVSRDYLVEDEDTVSEVSKEKKSKMKSASTQKHGRRSSQLSSNLAAGCFVYNPKEERKMARSRKVDAGESPGTVATKAGRGRGSRGKENQSLVSKAKKSRTKKST